MNIYLNPYFRWCAGCWDWVCDCLHCVEPLNIERQEVKDIQIRSVGYDRRRGRLEVEFTWTDDVRQFHPVSPAIYRQLLAAKPIYLFLNRILKSRRVRFEYVRTEAKPAIMMARIAYGLLELPAVVPGTAKELHVNVSHEERALSVAWWFVDWP